MKGNFLLTFLVLTLGTFYPINEPAANSLDLRSVIAHAHNPFFPGELLVKFREGTPATRISSLHRFFGVSQVREGYGKSYNLIEVPPGKERELSRKYLQQPEVLYVEPNYYRFALFVPNDEFYPLQWHFPLINLEAAWEVTTGGEVTVAVVDTGINPFGLDGFGNRLFLGYDAITGLPGGIDLNSHGTHVAGTIGQETNNLTGVAGIAHYAQILPVKVLCFLGFGLDSWIIDGIRWSADNGADIINLSLGGSSPSQAFEDALAYAYGKGVLIVAAAGNDGKNKVEYPAASEYCIAVGAVRYDKSRTYYSNYGSELDLVAPGGDLKLDQNGDGQGDGILQETFWFLGLGWDYWYATGTSMSAPHVTGIAALIKSLHSDYGPDEIRDALQYTAQDLGEPGWDEEYGYGLVDAYAAVAY